ncbi:hypothetical protein MPL3356_90082 [Mesorhizobium plurifarium]|uniref:BrnA antitoxin family protein n=1 Tax=Mesorhizobium plurifarium TaxID=69974 RepID=A0A090FWH4_MESPL|nr:hypothetical protein MPL3356_90082 [Mesorhizobium plurifarium]CDX46084.1 hypothetical protein MPLDJ20_80190 [Mesorhizobium plurifarium]CDX55515.1 hypothetical protein MPL3365_200107 [Mesorhizobium plurifarium]
MSPTSKGATKRRPIDEAGRNPVRSAKEDRTALLDRIKAAFNSDEEDAAITAAARTDPDAQPNLIKRGRPRLSNAKLAVLLRLDPDVVERFKAGGTGWQTRMNDALRRAAGLD